MQFPPLVLASSSPRRKELLALSGRPFDLIAANVNEDLQGDEEPHAYVLRVAAEKAEAALGMLGGGDALILAADTTVAQDGEILGKPTDAEDAKAVLKKLRGRSHKAITSISLIRSSDGARLADLAESDVPMRNYSDAEIDAYVATGNPLDKAGSYAIQHAGFHPVAKMQGCLANVVGLPLCHLTRSLRKWDLEFEVDLAEECQKFLSYDCPVTEKILAWEL
jgi:MAF protein